MATAESAAEPPIPDDAFAALRLPDFRRFLAGHFLASTGTQLQTVAVGWYLYERTGSALALGGVGLAQVLPIFLLTLPSGHLSDRYDRRGVLVVSQAVMALTYYTPDNNPGLYHEAGHWLQLALSG